VFSVRAGPLRTLVPLDGSPLAEAALSPAAVLTSALAAPGQGALHLSQVVKIFPTSADEGFISELNEEARQRAETYVHQVQLRLLPQATDLQISLTHEVAYASDVAGTLRNLAEHREQPHTAGGPCDLIAISTHGRAGLERWIMGSVTQRLLNATTLPMLIVRPSDKG
jgi:nucleotide-binding universal stress UspA family protein